MLNNVSILRVVSTVGVMRQAMRWSEIMKLVKVRLCLIVLDKFICVIWRIYTIL